MEETNIKKPGPYLIQILDQAPPPAKKRLTEAIAEAWGIPEDKVLGNIQIDMSKGHNSPYSAKGERERILGERITIYVNARKFYFYVLCELKKYKWTEITLVSGRRIAAIKYASAKAQEHMNLEKDYMAKAQIVLDLIERDLIIFPKPIITLSANVTVIDGGGIPPDPTEVQLPETGQ
jgi:hypothetical protein